MSNDPIRILHVIGAMNRAGAESMIMNLYRACDTQYVQFDFLVNEAGDYDEEINSLGGKIYRIPRYAIINRRSYRKACVDFFDAHKEHPIVHGHIGLPAAIYLSEARRRGIYAIAHSHAQNYPLSPAELVFRAESKRVRYNADYFMACSRQAGIDRFGTKIVDNSTIFHILNNGINLESYRFKEKKRSIVRHEIGLTDDTPVFGHVGRADPVKNHRFLLDTFAYILKSMPNAKLVLVGRPDKSDSIRTYACKLGIESSIIFLGLRDDVSNILCAFDVFVFTSLKEGLGMAVIEAQASGLPCVVSTGVPNMARVSDLVTFFDLNRGPESWAKVALEKYRQKPSCRELFADNVRASGFDIKTSAKWLQDFYLSHLGKITHK